MGVKQEIRTAILLLMLTACEHSAPFSPADFGTGLPFLQGPPTILTAGGGSDPAYLPDGSGFIFVGGGRSTEPFPSGTRDRCLSIMPPAGARATMTVCPPPDTSSDDVFGLPRVSPSGRLALTLTRGRLIGGIWYSGMMVTTLQDIRGLSELKPIPLVTPDGILHHGIEEMVWLHGDTVAFLDSGTVYLISPDDSARRITVLTRSVRVASIDTDSRGEVLFLTIEGDSRLFSLKLHGRGLTTIYDFGVAGTPGVIQISGTRAVAMVGSSLYLVDLAGQTRTAVDTYGLGIGQLALSRSGRTLIATATQSATGNIPVLALFRLP